MSATIDLIQDRRRERRKLTFWRVLAILTLIALAVVALARFGALSPISAPHVAQVWIDGVITADPDRAEVLAEIANSDAAEALIVRINSPGGTVVGSEELYENLRAVAARKPVVAVMSEAAASGGYVTAIAADWIVARQNTLTGSIGVVAEVPNVTGLLDMLGVEFRRVKSAPLKAEPAVLTEPEPGAFEAQEALIEDAFDWFRSLVGERRGLEDAALEQVSDGRVFSGRQALDLGLVDTLGGEEAAREWLFETHGIARGLPVVDRDWTEDDVPFPFGGAARLVRDVLPDAPRLDPGVRLYALIR